MYLYLSNLISNSKFFLCYYMCYCVGAYYMYMYMHKYVVILIMKHIWNSPGAPSTFYVTKLKSAKYMYTGYLL